jgi:hypothetical protein
MTIHDEHQETQVEEEFDDRMQTAYNGFHHFFKELDIAFPPYEDCNCPTRMRVFADSMKFSRVKMEQCIGRKFTSDEKEFILNHIFAD